VLAIGAVPLFMDVAPASHAAGLPDVERALDAGARAVVVTHLYGQAVAAIGAIAALCARRGVPLLEDCAQAHGARVEGRLSGSFGDAASFSFYPTKNLGALGDGGAVLCTSEAVAQSLVRLRQYGWSDKYMVQQAGGRNSRLDEVQAALLSALLPSLDHDNRRRRAIARRYSEGIAHHQVATPCTPGDDASHVAHLYVLRVRRALSLPLAAARDALRRHLHAHGIGADIHYPVPDHRQRVFDGRYATLRLPHTEALAAQVLTLPCYPELADGDVDTVIAAVNAWEGA
jgi:dTDP-4-amino-4,6-dideoxygalactose transaminase